MEDGLEGCQKRDFASVGVYQENSDLLVVLRDSSILSQACAEIWHA